MSPTGPARLGAQAIDDVGLGLRRLPAGRSTSVTPVMLRPAAAPRRTAVPACECLGHSGAAPLQFNDDFVRAVMQEPTAWTAILDTRVTGVKRCGTGTLARDGGRAAARLISPAQASIVRRQMPRP